MASSPPRRRRRPELVRTCGHRPILCIVYTPPPPRLIDRRYPIPIKRISPSGTKTIERDEDHGRAGATSWMYESENGRLKNEGLCFGFDEAFVLCFGFACVAIDTFLAFAFEYGRRYECFWIACGFMHSFEYFAFLTKPLFQIASQYDGSRRTRMFLLMNVCVSAVRRSRTRTPTHERTRSQPQAQAQGCRSTNHAIRRSTWYRTVSGRFPRITLAGNAIQARARQLWRTSLSRVLRECYKEQGVATEIPKDWQDRTV